MDKDNTIIIELDYEDDFNPLFIDMNDFQYLMPPFIPIYPYTKESISRILTDIRMGRITISEFPSEVMQAHLPYIEKKNLVSIYPLFDLE